MLGKLKGIRENGKADIMLHNFWAFSYIIQRFREKAEEYGIEVVEVYEYSSSSICPRCRSGRVIKRGRLFKCVDCGSKLTEIL